MIRASIEGYKEDIPVTKTTIADFGNTDYTAGERIAWVADDKIAVYFYEDIASPAPHVARSLHLINPWDA